MNEIVTHNTILQYVYGETDADTESRIKDALLKNPDLLHYYNEVMEVKRMLGNSFEEPDPTTVQIIGEYSHDSHTEAV
jgi:hypothetical protein